MKSYLVGHSSRDYVAGALVFALGLGASALGATYNVGSLTNMGPGFFPMSIGIIMATVGVVMVLGARAAAPLDEKREKKISQPEWKAWVYILTSIVAFVVLGTYGGLAPASFALVFIAALGDRENSWRQALVLALAMVVLAVLVFWWALQLQFPLFSWG